MNKWLVTLTVMLPTLIEIIDISIVNVSLDHIRGSLSAGIDESTWAITSYLVSNAVIIPMSGWLSRLMGRKRYLIASISLFTVSSFMCGAAWNLQSLIVFRVLQGIGGGGLQPVSQSILLETYPPRQHGMAMGIFGIGIMFGPILGPILGGVISDNWSWRWIFFINVPFCILAILMTHYVIKDPHYMQKTKMKIDYWGLALLAVGIGCLQMVLDKGERENWFDSGYITWLAVAAAFCLALFVIMELFAEHPIIDLRSFKNVSFTSGNLVMFFTFLSFFSSLVLLPIYLQTLMGYTATLAGFVLGPGGIATLVTMPIAGRLITKVNPKWMVSVGIVINAAAAWMLSNLNLTTDYDTVAWLRVLLGVGVGLIFVPLTTLTLSSVRKEEMGNAAAIYNFLRNLGGSFGVALVTTVVSRRAQFHQARLVEHLTPFDPAYVNALGSSVPQALQYGAGPGAPPPDQGGLGLIYRELIRQATMMSFNDAFFITFLVMLAIIPLVLLLKRPRHP